MVEKRILYRVWCGNLMERDHLKNLVLRGGSDIKMDLKEMGLGGVNWV